MLQFKVQIPKNVRLLTRITCIYKERDREKADIFCFFLTTKKETIYGGMSLPGETLTRAGAVNMNASPMAHSSSPVLTFGDFHAALASETTRAEGSGREAEAVEEL